MPHCNKQMISFFLTTRCNLCCTYCYNVKEREKLAEMSLPLEIAKGGIDWYFKNNSSRHIRFYGPGEPSFELQLMKDITEYARKVGGDSVTSEIQTNGIWNEETRNWILDNLNIVWMSFDGLPATHNKQRPLNKKYSAQFGERTSAEIVEDNTKWLIENKDNRNLNVGARVTMTDENIRQQIEMVDYFYSLGIRHVWTNPLFARVGQVSFNECKDREKNYFDMRTYVEEYLKAYEYAKGKGMFWGSFLIINFDGECVHHCRSCTPVPHLTPDGYLSACDLVLLGREPQHMAPFVYGKWNSETKEFEIDMSKVKTLQDRRTDIMPHCQNCEAKNHCAGFCLGEVLNETGTLYGQKITACQGVKMLFRALGKLDKFDLMHP